jgi:hypothetical protein
MAATKNSTTIEALTLLSQRLEREWKSSTAYREWSVVQKSLAELSGGSVSVVGPSRYNLRPVRMGRVTSISAAMEAIKAAGRPLSTRELLEVLPKYGFELRGKKEHGSALSSLLGKRGGKNPLVSVYVDNKPVWWFRDQPVPGVEVA